MRARFTCAPMSLNPQQRAAVEYTDGPVLVLAGAGSGKTRVIAEKIAHLVARKGMAPGKIAAITFTNRAAREMRERVGKLVKGAVAEELTLATFHALGLKIAQVEHAKLGLKRGFSVFDADDSAAIVKDLAPAAAKPDALFALRSLISNAKGNGLTPEQAAQSARSAREREAADVYVRYQKRLAAFNAVDFDDLIRLPLLLLESDDEARAGWQERIRYLLVDEYQDTNLAQYRLLKLLAGERGAFTCVGDDDQSIYAWRGANPGNLDELARDYPALKVIKLEQNYRCSGRILRAANALIAHNPHVYEKRLWSEHREGAPIRVLACKDDEHEAERIAADIAHQQQLSKASWNEFAVLYRGNHQSRPIEKALRALRVPYQLTGGTAFFERAEVKDVLAYLRLLVNPDDDAAFLRVANVPRREIGATTLEKLGELAQSRHVSMLHAVHSDAALKQLASRPAAALAGFAALIGELTATMRQSSAADLVEEIVRRTGFEAHIRAETKDESLRSRRLENIAELGEWFRAMGKNGGRAGDLAAQLALLTNADRDESGNAVRLMTLHSAKGLEFCFVYLIGVEQGTLPHVASMDEGRLDEERRLFYVGITRAKERLCLAWAERSRRYGEVIANEPSRFLAELPQADLHWDGRDAEQDAEVKRETAAAHMARLAQMFAR
ncbi:MAG TPA: UvrD-helicase domain-containing protein [Rudaea sp.]|nr:UvrD-helicase domain-containing protein [Rudaea sp.]